MFSDPQLKGSDVKVTSTKGEVTLSGTVPGDAARLDAYKLALTDGWRDESQRSDERRGPAQAPSVATESAPDGQSYGARSASDAAPARKPKAASYRERIQLPRRTFRRKSPHRPRTEFPTPHRD